MKKHLLLSILALFCISMVSAQTIIDQWTFEGDTPQTSTNNKTIDKWDPALATNSHAGSVLTYGETGTAGGAFYGSSYLGLSTPPDNITITVDIVDFSFAANGAWRFQFTGPGSGTGDMRGEFNIYNDNVSLHIEGNGTSLNGSGFIKQSDYSEFTSLQLTYTWDFANNEMSYAVSGTGVPVDSEPASFSDSGNAAADLSGITEFTSFRLQTTPDAGSSLEMDTLTIAYTAATASTVTDALANAKVWYSDANNTLHVDGVLANVVTVYSLTGTKVAEYKKPNKTILLNQITPGIYVVKVDTDFGLKTVKIIK